MLDQETAELAATRAKLKRTERRVANGVCPHCHRSFVQLERHMRTKHSEEVSP
jgi:ssDNA-binding Zn-finger/Zn-ribbon topoisomerase 1